MLAAAVVTLLLAVAVIHGTRVDIETAGGGYEKIDVNRAIRLIDDGRLSGHPADHWETIP